MNTGSQYGILVRVMEYFDWVFCDLGNIFVLIFFADSQSTNHLIMVHLTDSWYVFCCQLYMRTDISFLSNFVLKDISLSALLANSRKSAYLRCKQANWICFIKFSKQEVSSFNILISSCQYGSFFNLHLCNFHGPCVNRISLPRDYVYQVVE